MEHINNKKLQMNKDGDFIYTAEEAKEFPAPMKQPKPVKVNKYCYYCGLPAKNIDPMINEPVCENCGG